MLKPSKRRRLPLRPSGPLGPPGRFSHSLWLWPLVVLFVGAGVFTWVFYPTLDTAFSLPRNPSIRLFMALGVSFTSTLMGFVYLLLWWAYYVSAVLPLVSYQSKRLLIRLAWHYMQGRHGPAYQVMNGKKIETFTPHHRQGWQVVLLDSASAAVVHYMGQYDVLGPGVHFLSPHHTLVAFFDLREHRTILKGKTKNSPTRGRTADGIPISADLAVVCYLDDFHPDPRWKHGPKGPRGEKPPKALDQAAEDFWLRVYQEPAKVLRRHATFVTPFFGHRLSILKAFENLDPETLSEEATCTWWQVAEHTATELWLKLVERYTLSELFPPSWKIPQRDAQDASFQTGYERLRRVFQERLTQPYYWDDQQQRWLESPEFFHLLEHGVRVRAASISMVYLEDEALTEHTYIDPLQDIIHSRQQALTKLASQLERKAQVEAASQWMRLLQQTIHQHPELHALVQAFTDGHEGQGNGGRAHSVDLSPSTSRKRLIALLEACLEAWYPLMDTPDLARSEEFQTLRALRHWLRMEKGRE